jgi:hypothetical protein
MVRDLTMRMIAKSAVIARSTNTSQAARQPAGSARWPHRQGQPAVFSETALALLQAGKIQRIEIGTCHRRFTTG